MILTLEQYRALSGDTASPDAQVQRWLNKYTDAIERYCDRRFGWYEGSETYHDIRRDPVLLNRRPVAELQSVTIDGTAVVPAYVHYTLGQLHHRGAWIGRTVVVQYIGGMVAPIFVQEILVALVTDALNGVGDSSRPVVRETVVGVESVTYGDAVGLHPVLGAYANQLDALVDIHVG